MEQRRKEVNSALNRINMKNQNWHCKLLATVLIATLVFGCSKNDKVSRVTPDTGNIFRDVEYARNKDWQGNSVTLAMDIYQPPGLDAAKKYPLVIYFHGGGYNGGDRTTAVQKCTTLADSGFIAATIDYRLGWDSGGAADPCSGDTLTLINAIYRGIQDANAALRFLVANADKFNIDPNWIFIGGSSAGADVALTTTYMNDAYVKQRFPASSAALGSLYNAGNNLTNTYTIKGLYAISGSLLDSNLINANKAVPSIFFHGDQDNVAPIDAGHYLGCEN